MSFYRHIKHLLGDKKVHKHTTRDQWLDALPYRADRRRTIAAILDAGHFTIFGVQTKVTTRSYLAQHAGVSTRAIDKTLKALVDDGFLLVNGESAKYSTGHQPTPLYRLALPSFTDPIRPDPDLDALAALDFGDYPEFWSQATTADAPSFVGTAPESRAA